MAKKNTTEDLNVQKTLNRAERVRKVVSSISTGDAIVARRKIGNIDIAPVMAGIGSRAKMGPAWRSIDERRVNPADMKDAAKVVDPKALKGKLERRADYIGSYYGFNGLLRPEYDLQEPFALFDQEAYLKQAINRKLALMFRTGFEITSDQSRLAEYIQRRFETIEYVTSRSMEELFKAIIFNLSLCSNCFVLKIRDAKASTGVKSEKNSNKTPIAGYGIIPAHTLFPWMEMGVIKKWRRIYDFGLPWEDYDVDDIIHFKWDVKPGHIFGTPRTIAVRDDIFALRRLEENLELLFINHLFPLFHIKVGTETNPCDYYDDGSSEIDYIKYQIENMPKEGVFVTDERVDVNVVGAQKESLQFKELVAHLKGRVYTGLGVSAVDMGEGDTANRATADNISQVLKDSIKNDQGSFGQQVRMYIFKELFMEANQSVSVQGATAETRLEWHEVDTDGKIKEENHAQLLFQNNMIGRAEARKRMRLKPMEKEQEKDTAHEKIDKDFETHKAKLTANENDRQHERDKEMASHEAEQQKKLAETQMSLMSAEVAAEHGKAEAHQKKAASQVMVLKAKAKAAQAGVGVGSGNGKKASKKRKPGKNSAQSRNTPSNQHGTNPGPTKAKSSLDPLRERIYDRLVSNLQLWNGKDLEEWDKLAKSGVEGVGQDYLAELGEDESSSYTRQVRRELDRLKMLTAGTTDPEMLYVVITESDEDLDDVEVDTAGTGDLESESGTADDDPEYDGADDGGDSDTLRDEAGDSDPSGD